MLHLPSVVSASYQYISVTVLEFECNGAVLVSGYDAYTQMRVDADDVTSEKKCNIISKMYLELVDP